MFAENAKRASTRKYLRGLGKLCSSAANNRLNTAWASERYWWHSKVTWLYNSQIIFYWRFNQLHCFNSNRRPKCPSMRKISCAGQKHFDQLKSEPGPTCNSALQLPRWRWPVMQLWRLNVYGAIMSTLLLDSTILESFLCSTMQSYQKLSTKVVSTLVLFVTTYLFESGFSVPLHLKKNKYRNRLNLRTICAWVWISVCQGMSG